MGLAGVPGTLHPQPVHGRHQVQEPGPRQVSRAVQQLSLRRDRRLGTRLGQPHHINITGRSQRLDGGIVHDPVGDPGLVQRGQLRMTGRNEHGGRRPQGLPGRELSSPGATLGLVTRTISKPVSARPSGSAAAAPGTRPPGWARRRPGTGCSSAGRTAG